MSSRLPKLPVVHLVTAFLDLVVLMNLLPFRLGLLPLELVLGKVPSFLLGDWFPGHLVGVLHLYVSNGCLLLR